MENGGSGIIPDGARNNFGKTKPKNSQLMSNLKREFKPFVAEDVKNIPLISLESEFKLPELSSIVEPRSSDVLKMFELGKRMMMTGADGVRMKNVDKSRLKMTLSSLEVMLLASKPLPSSSRSVSHGYGDVNSSHDSRDVRQRSSDDVGGKRSRSRSFTDRSHDDHRSQSRHYRKGYYSTREKSSSRGSSEGSRGFREGSFNSSRDSREWNYSRRYKDEGSFNRGFRKGSSSMSRYHERDYGRRESSSFSRRDDRRYGRGDRY